MKSIISYATAIALMMASCKQTSQTTPQRKNIVDAVFASGNITTVNEYNITALEDGYLNASMVSAGDSVKKNQVLFRLMNDVQQSQVANAFANYQYAKNNATDYSPQIIQVQEQINAAMLKKQTDEVNLHRYENLVKTNAVAKSDYDNVLLTYQNDVSNITVLQKTLATLKQDLSLNEANTKAQYQIQQQNNNYYNLSSAGNGLVLDVFKHNGDLVKKGETVATIGSGEKIIRLFIDEDNIQKVQLSQRVLILLNTDKTNIYEATISKIYPSFDENSQSFIVEATFNQTPSLLKDGTQLQANIVIAEKKNALVIPAPYLQDNNSVLLKDNKTAAIKTGIRTMQWVEVLSGLSDNETIELPKQK